MNKSYFTMSMSNTKTTKRNAENYNQYRQSLTSHKTFNALDNAFSKTEHQLPIACIAYIEVLLTIAEAQLAQTQLSGVELEQIAEKLIEANKRADDFKRKSDSMSICKAYEMDLNTLNNNFREKILALKQKFIKHLDNPNNLSPTR